MTSTTIKAGDWVWYRGNSGRWGRYRVQVVRQQKWTSYGIGPRRISRTTMAEVVDLELGGGNRTFTVPLCQTSANEFVARQVPEGRI